MQILKSNVQCLHKYSTFKLSILYPYDKYNFKVVLHVSSTIIVLLLSNQTYIPKLQLITIICYIAKSMTHTLVPVLAMVGVISKACLDTSHSDSPPDQGTENFKLHGKYIAQLNIYIVAR